MNVKHELLRRLAENNGNFVSGAALAESLNVSRNAVWKAVKSLEADGFTIESAVQKGYRLSEKNNKLADELITQSLKTNFFGKELKIFDELVSTNITAKELASNGAAHGTVVIADMQSGGKGRLGRSFVSPPGNGIYMSIIIRPELDIKDSAMITSAAACAAAEAVEKLCGKFVNIKWVNDLYMNGKKICGILTEASLSMEMNALEYAVVGIGINVRKINDCFSSELKEIVSSIEDETGIVADRNLLCAEILNNFEIYLENIRSRCFLNEYRKREYLTGNKITAVAGNQSITGKALGIDDNANLIVELADGSVKHLGSGEANLCRIAD